MPASEASQPPEGSSCLQESSNTDLCPDINTDHRKKYDWKSKYPKEAYVQIVIEMLWGILVLFAPLYFIVQNWDGLLTNPISLCLDSQKIIHIYFIYACSGMLGGATYGAKYLYRVVGRGYWHRDRLVWRIMSPFISMILGLIVGTLIESAMLSAPGKVSLGRCISIGFMSGYFADQAVGKMCDVAEAIFGKATPQN